MRAGRGTGRDILPRAARGGGGRIKLGISRAKLARNRREEITDPRCANLDRIGRLLDVTVQ